MKTKTKKVYLAKSNRSNPNDVSRVRTMLEKLDVEVVEYTGGKYSTEPLISCDFLIVVPDLSDYDYDYHLYNELHKGYVEESVPLGKGLHEQIFTFNNDNFAFKNIFIVKYSEVDLVMASEVDKIDMRDFTDYIHHSNLTFSDETFELDELLTMNGVKTKNEVFMETKGEYGDNYYDVDAMKKIVLGWTDAQIKAEALAQLTERDSKISEAHSSSYASLCGEMMPKKERSRRYLLIKNLRK